MARRPWIHQAVSAALEKSSLTTARLGRAGFVQGVFAFGIWHPLGLTLILTSRSIPLGMPARGAGAGPAAVTWINR